jgi:hypothetical protein
MYQPTGWSTPVGTFIDRSRARAVWRCRAVQDLQTSTSGPAFVRMTADKAAGEAMTVPMRLESAGVLRAGLSGPEVADAV